MSCWVVPAVAAEYWGVSLDTVWWRIQSGSAPCKVEDGFTFIDVAPWSVPPVNEPQHVPPPTFVLADDESAPVIEWSQMPEEYVPLGCHETEMLSDEPGDVEEPCDEEDLPELDEEESATFGRLSWQEVRQQVSRTRRPPAAAA